MKQILIIISLSIFSLTSLAQLTIADVTLPSTRMVNGKELVLNGAGLREKLWIDLYVGGLYVSTKSKDAKTIIDAKTTMSIHIEIVSDLITKDKFLDAVNEGFDLALGDKRASLEESISKFVSAFESEFVDGDIIDLEFSPELGVSIQKNGKRLSTIKGYEFKKALFAIWFGEKPADKKLKEGMLGNK